MFKLKIFVVIILMIHFSCKDKKNSQGENFSENINKVASEIIDDSEQLKFFEQPKQPIQNAFTHFSTSSVKPKGWILKLMQEDLEHGFVGKLDELYPGIKSDDLYRTARRGGMEDIPEMGDLVLTGADWETSIMWWNAETIGNWWDGFVRYAYLTDNKPAQQKADAIVNNLLASQDKDGYIGIYKPNLRYKHEGSNGELWAQTTAFRTLLAYYELTGKQEVLNAVEKAMAVTMKHYGNNSKNPFQLKNAFGGVTHGLMLTDVCETLYRITGEIIYQDYATYLYQAFSTFSVNRSFNDLRYPFLIQKDSLFQGHAVHTYEHLRSVINAYYHTGYPELESAYQNMLHKLDPCILPSGAGHGNEWINELEAHPEHTGAEFCAMLELRNSYGSMLQKTGKVKFADAAETLTYNAMLGARNQNGTAITYGKPDNCYVLDGKHHENGTSREDPRYKYSPTHSEPAVCCNPNYGRNFTYFLDQLWMKSENGIAAVMYGPSELSTEINRTKVSITQETNYPWSDAVTFKFQLEKPQNFTFMFRKPAWTNDVKISGTEAKLEGDYYSITREWQNGDSFSIQFKNEAKILTAKNNEAYIQRGPVVFAYEIPHKEEVIKTYENETFTDYYCFAENDTYKNLGLNQNAHFKLESDPNKNSFHNNDWILTTNLYSMETSEYIHTELVPMGSTILRRVTFPIKN